DRQEAQSVAKGADIAGAVVAPGGELERVFFNVHDIAAQGDPVEVAKTLERERRVPVVLLGSERNGQRRAVRIGTKELLLALVRSRSRELARDARRRRQRDTRERKHERESQCERLSHFANSP